jgi:hypothetical protein
MRVGGYKANVMGQWILDKEREGKKAEKINERKNEEKKKKSIKWVCFFHQLRDTPSVHKHITPLIFLKTLTNRLIKKIISYYLFCICFIT